MAKRCKANAAIAVISFILSFFLAQNCKAQNLQPDSGVLCFSIQFNEYFKNDKVDLTINDSLIFKKAVLTSNPSYGLTNVWATITKKNGRYYIATSESKIENPVSFNPDIVKVTLRYHNKQKNFVFKLTKGKYVVFNDDGRDKISCSQTIRMPFFD
nr:hypothetical protein [uncultured Mucilaginibacter sp.]